MSWGAGLLTVAGRAGEGGFKGMNKNIDEAIEEKKAAALEKRLLNLEKVRHGHSQEDVRLADTLATSRGKTAYEQKVADEESRYQKRHGEEETTYQRRLAEKESQELLSHKRELDEPGTLGKMYNDLVNMGYSEDKAKEVLLDIKTSSEGTDKGRDKLIADAYMKGAQALSEGKATLSAVNASLKTVGAPMRFEEDEEGTFKLVSDVPAIDSNEFDFDAVFGWQRPLSKGKQKPKTNIAPPSGLLMPNEPWDNATRLNPY